MAEIGIVPHLLRNQARELARELISVFEGRGDRVRVPATDAARTGLGEWSVPDAEFGPGLSLACSLGGDGTMLHTVELVARDDVPVLGVNVGHLGYLTAAVPEELPALLPRLLAGDYSIDERMTLSVKVQIPDAPARTYLALNEAVLEKRASGHTVRLGVYFNDEFFINYAADGLIVATPTGSTAYALSARGPIVSPRLAAIVVVPVSPHTLFDRALVLGPHERVRVDVLDGRTALLFVDGRDSGDLPEGSTVSCTADEHPARLVRFADRDFHQILKNKFGLPGPDTDRRWIIDGIDSDAFGFSDADDEAVERARSTRSPDAG